MIYPKLEFPKLNKRPFFYTNFVTTIDGKAQVLPPDPNPYWPMGSSVDFDTLLDLRARADVLVHGRNTVGGVIKRTDEERFKQKRIYYQKPKPLIYVVVTSHPDDSLVEYLTDSKTRHIVATTGEAEVSEKLSAVADIVRLGKNKVDIRKLSKYLFNKGYKEVLVEGGPHLLGDFIKENLIDEVFLTIAPKIIGGEIGKTITMVEGNLRPPDKVMNLEIIEMHQVENEVFLRYRVNH